MQKSHEHNNYAQRARSLKNYNLHEIRINMTNNISKNQWQFLEPRSSSWRKQLYFKGRKLTAFTVWSDMIVNEDTLGETAANWDLSTEAIKEAIEYCENNRELLKSEAEEERRYLEERGVILEPKITHR